VGELIKLPLEVVSLLPPPPPLHALKNTENKKTNLYI
jgi:hypothetical protein